jgi:hypothetical protein
MVLERELRPPTAGFQCIDIPHVELVAAGLEPDRTTGAVTFRADIRSRVGSKKTRPSGAIMITDAATGKIELYEPIDWTDPPDPDVDPPDPD